MLRFRTFTLCYYPTAYITSSVCWSLKRRVIQITSPSYSLADNIDALRTVDLFQLVADTRHKSMIETSPKISYRYGTKEPLVLTGNAHGMRTKKMIVRSCCGIFRLATWTKNSGPCAFDWQTFVLPTEQVNDSCPISYRAVIQCRSNSENKWSFENKALEWLQHRKNESQISGNGTIFSFGD